MFVIRRSVQSRMVFATMVAAAAFGTILAGCDGTPGGYVTASETTTVSTSSGTSPAATSSSAETSTSTSTSTSGTVVPFGTVPVGSGVGLRLGLVASTGSDPFGKAVTDSIVAQVEVAGAELINCDPGGDWSLVLDCTHRMANEHIDGWVALQPGAVGAALCDAAPAGVPLIAIAATSVTCQTAGVGADNQEAGFLVGEQLGRASRSPSSCAHDVLVIVTDSAAATLSEQRIDGIRDGFATQCPGPVVDERVLDAGSQDRAYDAFTSSLSAVPDDADILVAAVNDGAALGVVAAIPVARAKNITVAAIGADQRARCEIIANPSWIGDAALFPDRYGDVVVPALLDAVHGLEIPANMFVQTTFVTAETLGAFYDLTDCPAR